MQKILTVMVPVLIIGDCELDSQSAVTENVYVVNALW